MADLEIDGFKTDTPPASGPLVWLNQVRGALIRVGFPVVTEKAVRATNSQNLTFTTHP